MIDSEQDKYYRIYFRNHGPMLFGRIIRYYLCNGSSLSSRDGSGCGERLLPPDTR